MSEIIGALSGLKIVACSTAQAGTVPYMLMACLLYTSDAADE